MPQNRDHNKLVQYCIAALGVASILIYAFFYKPNGHAAHVVTESSHITVPGYDFGVARLTVVVAVRYGCHYCEASQEFYSKLIKTIALQNATSVRLIFISQEDKDLATQDLPNIKLTYSIYSGVTFPPWVVGTPTMLFVDPKGVLIKAYEGVLDTSQEKEVMSSVSMGKVM